MKTPIRTLTSLSFLTLVPLLSHAQVNSGSNGSDGALNPTTNIVINMADHPTGIYQYTSVNISNVVTVTFIPNANNTPVTWLVQSNVVINGIVDVSAKSTNSMIGSVGGPGGWAGGSGGSSPSQGQGPGGGIAGISYGYGGGGAFATQGEEGHYGQSEGQIYGNSFLLPLLGGSGGGGSPNGGGGGGGGAILIAASLIQLNGSIQALGADAVNYNGGGSGGAVRLVATSFSGTGVVLGGGGQYGGGAGRIRIDCLQSTFGGSFSGGVLSQGFQPIIIPTSGQLPQLTVTSVGGVPVSASPTGALATPDAVLSAQQNNPIPIVVSCANLSLHTLITVSVKPASGSPVSATGYNDTGTQTSSTATISIVMPRGGGLIYATAATGN